LTTVPPVKVGDRVRCTAPLDDGFLGINLELIGVEGTVTWVGDWASKLTSQIGVQWDNGSTLNLLLGDPYVVLRTEWEVDFPVVDACVECGAPGDVECRPECADKDFRDAAFDGVLDPEGAP
jgi:hypothetical protein